MVKVSVIIPCFNMGLYLEECLNSVLHQTLQGIEIICINDGSTDNTLDIIRRYQFDHDNVILVNQENKGVSIARNNGLLAAKGEFISFMDPDDFYPEVDILEYLYDKAKENKVLICGGSLNFYKDGRILSGVDELGRYQPFHSNRRMSYHEYNYAGGFTRFLYQREFLRNNQIDFPDYLTYEDPPFFVRAMILAGEFYAVRKVTYCYRIGHKTSGTSLKRTVDYAKGVLDVLKLSKAYGWSEMYADTISELNKGPQIMIYNYISKDSKELNELVKQINTIIDQELLPGDDPVFRQPFLPDPQEVAEKKERIAQILGSYGQLVIYGAGVKGRKAADYLAELKNYQVMCFAVTDINGNPSDINGIPVKKIEDILLYKDTALIIIAVRDSLQPEVKCTLEKLQFKNLVAIEDLIM